jgi:ArsR family metal-binding transcriptional regulator
MIPVNIDFQVKKTYFIASKGSDISSIYAVGEVDLNQVMDSGLDKLEEFTEYDLFKNRLDDLGLIGPIIKKGPDDS